MKSPKVVVRLFRSFQEGKEISRSDQLNTVGCENSVTVRFYKREDCYEGVYKGCVWGRPKWDGMGVAGEAKETTCSGSECASTRDSKCAWCDCARHK